MPPEARGLGPRGHRPRGGPPGGRSSPAPGAPWDEVREAILRQLPESAAAGGGPSRKAVLAQLHAARKNKANWSTGESAAAAAVGTAAADDQGLLPMLPQTSARSSRATLLPSEAEGEAEPGGGSLPQSQSQEPGARARRRSQSQEPEPGGGPRARRSLPQEAEPEPDALEGSLQGSVPWPTKLARRPTLPGVEDIRAITMTMTATMPLPSSSQGKRRQLSTGSKARSEPETIRPWRPMPGEGTRRPLTRSELGEVSWQDAFGHLPPQPRDDLLPLDPRAALSGTSRKLSAACFPSVRALRTCADGGTGTATTTTPRSSSSGSLLSAAPTPPRIRQEQLPPLPGAAGEVECMNDGDIEPRQQRPLAHRLGLGGSSAERNARSVPCAKAGYKGWPGCRPVRKCISRALHAVR